MTYHHILEPGNIHSIHNWEYANAAARTGASGFVAADIGKVARQTDNETYYILTSTAPTWLEVGGGGSGGLSEITFQENKTFWNEAIHHLREAADGYAYKVSASVGDGYLAFYDANLNLAGDNDLFWNRENNYLGLGTTSPTSRLDVVGYDSEQAAIKLTGYGTSANAFGRMYMRASDGTADSPSAIEHGNILGFTYYQGYNGASFGFGGGFGIAAEGNWSGSNQGTYAVIYTTPQNTTSWQANHIFKGDGAFLFREISSVANAGTGYGALYAKTDGKIYYKAHDGSETDLTSGGGAAGSNTEVQYNDSGSFGASSAFVYDGTTLSIKKGSVSNSNLLLGQVSLNNTYYPALTLSGGTTASTYPYLTTSNGGLVLYVAGGSGGSFIQSRINLNSSISGTGSINFEFGGTTYYKMLNTGEFSLKEIASGSTPDSGYGAIYVKTDGNLYFKDDAGVEYNILSAGSLSVSGTPVNDQIAVWTDADTLEGTSNLTYTYPTLSVWGGTLSSYAQIRLEGGSYTTGTNCPRLYTSNGGLALYIQGGDDTPYIRSGILLASNISGTGNIQFQFEGTSYAIFENTGEFALKEITSGSTPPSGWGHFYVKTSDNHPYYKTSAGAEYDLLAAGALSVSGTPADNYVTVWTDSTTVEGTDKFQYSWPQLTIVGDLSANSNYPYMTFAGGTNATTYPRIVTSNGGLVFIIQSGYSTPYNNTARIQLSTLDAGNSTIKWMFGGTTIMQLEDTGELWLSEISSSNTPSSGYGAFYAKTDGKAYFKNDSGTEYDLTSGGGVDATSGADNRIAVFTDADSIEGDANFTWNGTQLGIGTTPAAGQLIDVSGSIDADTSIRVVNTNTGNSAYAALRANAGQGNIILQGIGDNSTWTLEDGTPRAGSGEMSAWSANRLTLWTNNLAPIHIAPNWKPILTVTPDRSVGINTKYPIEALTINGVLALQEQTATPATQDGYGKLWTDSAGELRYTDDDGNTLQITNSGSLNGGGGDVTKVGTPLDNQVGVWTGDGTIEGTSRFTQSASGYVAMTVESAATNTIADTLTIGHQTSATPANGIGTAIEFQCSRVADALQTNCARIESICREGAGTSADYWDMAFWTRDDDNVAERMRIRSNGTVGIGTTTPSSTFKLDVNGRIRTTMSDTGAGLYIHNSNTAYDPRIHFLTNNSLRFVAGVDGSDSNKFKIDIAEDWSNQMLTIDTSGQIGLGTNSPSHKLDVRGSVDGIVDMYIYNATSSASSRTGLQISTNHANYMAMYVYSNSYSSAGFGGTMPRSDSCELSAYHRSDGHLRYLGIRTYYGEPIYMGTVWTQYPALTISSDQNIGIDTINPHERLTINGRIALQAGPSPGAEHDVDGYGTVYVDSSDNKLYYQYYNSSPVDLTSGGGGAPQYTITASKTGNYTAAFDEIVRCDPSGGGFTITLPAASGGTGQTVIVKNTTSSTNIITIDGNGAETIDSQAFVEIAEGYKSLTFVSYGSEWGII